MTSTFLASNQRLVVWFDYHDDERAGYRDIVQQTGDVAELIYWLWSGIVGLLRRAVLVRIALVVMWTWQRDIAPAWRLVAAHWRALPGTLWGPGWGEDLVMVALVICEPIWRMIRWAVEEMVR